MALQQRQSTWWLHGTGSLAGKVSSSSSSSSWSRCCSSGDLAGSAAGSVGGGFVPGPMTLLRWQQGALDALKAVEQHPCAADQANRAATAEPERECRCNSQDQRRYAKSSNRSHAALELPQVGIDRRQGRLHA